MTYSDDLADADRCLMVIEWAIRESKCEVAKSHFKEFKCRVSRLGKGNVVSLEDVLDLGAEVSQALLYITGKKPPCDIEVGLADIIRKLRALLEDHRN